MKWFLNLKISKKIILACIFIGIVSGVILGTVSIVNVRKVSDSSQNVYDNNIVPLTPVNRIQADFLKMRIKLRDMALSKDKDKTQYVNQINDINKEINDSLSNYEPGISSDKEKNNFNLIKDDLNKFTNVRDKIISLISSNQLDDAIVLITTGEGNSIANELDGYIKKAFELNTNQAKDKNTSNENTANLVVIIMIVVTILTVIIALILGLVVSNVIVNPIKLLVSYSDRMALGDVNINIQNDYKDEIGDLMNSFKKMISNIRENAIAAESISKGNLDVEIKVNSKEDILGNSMKLVVESLTNLEDEMSKLTQASVDGKLSIRGETDKFMGGYKKIVEGVNRTLDAVIQPIKEASAVLEEVSNGNLKIYVKGDYKGDHAEIKNSLNSTIQSFSQYINEISQILGEMSNSNLDLSINSEYKGDFMQIKEALNLIIKSFNDIFSEINNSADQVSTGSDQVASGSQALSQGTTEQASSIEELTSSITEVASQTKQNAVNASQANELALNAKDGAIQGNNHMKEMLKSMEEINESSTNISKIIKVIDDIAFQTNILALNAAVEAARAGQHGKGFAVVAEEVRNLAARSASAAKETTDLIEGSIKKVEMGTKIANNTAEALDKIVEGVSKAATLVGEIASASNEQATSISQINKGIEQVSDVVQTNSATAQQSAAASEELSSQASMLKRMIGNFKLKKYSLESYDEASTIVTNKEVNKKAKPKIFLSDTSFGKY